MTSQTDGHLMALNGGSKRLTKYELFYIRLIVILLLSFNPRHLLLPCGNGNVVAAVGGFDCC